MRTAVCALLMSIPLLMFGTASHAEKIVAMFLVATTMPVALVAVSESLPREPAFAFGLTGMALLVGALPGFTPAQGRSPACASRWWRQGWYARWRSTSDCGWLAYLTRPKPQHAE